MIAQPVMAFFSMPDTVLILVIALLLFGPKNLPKMARGIGKSMEEFRRAAREIETEIMKEPEPTTPPPPPPPAAAEGAPATEQTPESEHPYGETGEEYQGYESETGPETTPSAPVVVSDTPVVLPADAAFATAAIPVAAAPVATPEVAATPAPSVVPVPASVPAADVPPAASAAAPAVTAAPANPPTEKKTDAQTAA